MWQFLNPNPCGRSVGDCVIRALSILLNQSWEQTYTALCITGFLECDMPNANHVWGKYLEENGFVCEPLYNTSVRQFAKDNPFGRYVLATGEHVVTVIDGYYYDAWEA